jgi:hypothetical protein
MSSNRPDLPPDRVPRPGRRGLRAAVAIGAVACTLLLTTSLAAAAGAQSGGGSGDGATATTVAPTTTNFPETEDCGPGHIVRQPDCGVPPKSPTDRGGWLQVSLFYLICAVLVGITAYVTWRAAVARKARAAAGRDPLTLARARGQGMRRSTRSEPVADTSSKRPEASAGT